jgi:hypothetical protein
MPDGSEYEGSPPIDWQEECKKAQSAAQCFRQLYMEAMANLADLRVSLTLMQQEKDNAELPRS